jgi:hypothetical protein
VRIWEGGPAGWQPVPVEFLLVPLF